MKTLLQTIQLALGELRLGFPTVVLSSTQGSIVQARALVIAACDELLEKHDWQRLIRTHTFTTVNGQSLYPLPADYYKLLNDTTFSVTNERSVPGSLTPGQWSYVRDGIDYVGSWPLMRIVGNQLELLPTPGGGEEVSLQYMSRNYVVDGATQVLKPEFTADSDQTVFEDRLLINYLKLKLMEVLGMNTLAAANDFNSSLNAAKGKDVPSRTLNMIPVEPDVFGLNFRENVQ